MVTSLAPDRFILDVEGARDVGPTEAEGLIRECLALTYRRFDAAIWRALEELGGLPSRSALRYSPLERSGGPMAGAPPDSATGKLGAQHESAEVTFARAVRRESSKVFPRFRSEFDQAFAARRSGKPRTREHRVRSAASLALVGEVDHAAQVSLKNAVQAMRTATREEGFGFDLRTRMIMRESPDSGEYKNPWGADIVSDAIGNTCRALWEDDAVWRRVMERLVRALTPELVALHRELDRVLQDRDVLPVLRVRTRKRSASGEPLPDGAEDLYGKVAQLLGRETSPGAPRPPQASPPRTMPTPPASDITTHGDPLDFGNPQGWHEPVGVAPAGATSPAGTPWIALQRALQLLERSRVPASPGSELASADSVPREENANVIPDVEAAVATAGDPPLDRVTVEIVSAVLDEVFDNPYLPPEMKAVFGRIQIPILKAALQDRDVLANPHHRVRKFFDALAAASIGLRPEIPHDALFIELATHLASSIREQLGDDADAFGQAKDELETFLDAERAAYNQKLAQALPSLVALDDDADARNRARTALAVRYAGKSLPPEFRDYLEHEGEKRLAGAYLAEGAVGEAWQRELALLDDLVWSIEPAQAPGARKRLLHLIPGLVRALSEGWSDEESARVRRKVFLARLYELHVQALNALPDLPAVESEDAAEAPHDADVPAERDEDAEGDDTDTLLRGDWCTFEGENEAAPMLAKFAWRAPHGTQLLFTHRDGAIALIHTPASLAREFRNGRAKVVVEAIPLFERALEKLLAQRQADATAEVHRDVP